MAKVAKPVIVSLKELSSISLDTLTTAFGEDSLGIIVVKDLPDSYHALRKKVLIQASYLSRLPPATLKSLESPDAYYLTGWSHGKEKLASGELDTYKGSYYINCAFYKSPDLEGPPPDECKGFETYKAYTEWNKWPKEETPEMKAFQANCKALISLMISVADNVAKCCEKYRNQLSLETGTESVVDLIKASTVSKARLLHYFPIAEASTHSTDDWCGEHLDHSILTALTRAIYFKEDTMEEVEPDEGSGLYIRDRHGEHVKVNIPANCMAFQTGSCLQELTAGQFKAVPHYVSGTKQTGVCRNTLAVFLQPSLNEKVNAKENFAQYADRILKGNH